MKYISTRGGIEPIPFTEAVMMGLSSDGGLILPENIPDVSDKLNDWKSLSYQDLAYEIISVFAGGDIPDDDLRRLVNQGYSTFDHSDIVPIKALGDMFIMELFHGPTLAFKDIALQLLGNLFEYILKRDDRILNILGATSGDTGSAAIYGVRGRDNIKIFILHPYQRVSPVQELQMTTVLDDNVFNIAIKGTFDDGQRIIKELFNDLDFKKRYSLGAVNSVNWARVAAQVVYYFYGALKVTERTGKANVRFCVPTGNFGNIFAGYLATRMGAPISKLVLATNENDILTRFFETGIYSISDVKQTLSPSMDIQIASNFERYLYYLTGTDSIQLKSLMNNFKNNGTIEMSITDLNRDFAPFLTDRGDDVTTVETIKKYHESFAYLVDPHTAVGIGIAEKHMSPDEPMICLATAHPAKFGAAVKQALGADIACHEKTAGLHNLPTRCIVLPAETVAVCQYLEEIIGSSPDDSS